ncbi:hypothetical protein MCU_00704 [Bartonella elizabethae Re6043vi]|uniref:Uncharacterized protein n=2 Tax=Bartonella elizabethae TaxID=807 RepID=J1A4S8_BAREL|nr:hypothetical protein [Bartonella elizabethae]EJF84036.1 hypothetical protein MCU_00704 [Bartonella elizabethae Re6043vi]EJF96723.1 hypothetical protein MEE_00622 [Bartonella elizabethae F9251 = ATCC 49927]VEJ40221.1 Site-specific DNA methylase [Bartonella elizabethae]
MSSREAFERLRTQDPKTLTDLERALRFLYLQRLSFGGKVAKQTFGVDPHRGARFNSLKLEASLKLIYRRLAGVTIEHLDWFEFILGAMIVPTSCFTLIRLIGVLRITMARICLSERIIRGCPHCLHN